MKAEQQEQVARIIEQIKNNDEFAIGALMTLYHRQEEDEKYMQTTSHQNGAGFNMIDADILTSIAEWYKDKGFLTERQMSFIKPKLHKYAKQLMHAEVAPRPNGKRPVPPVAVPQASAASSQSPTKFVTLEGNTLLVSFPYNPQTVADVKNLPGRRWCPDRKLWTLPQSFQAVEGLRNLGFELRGKALQDWFASFTKGENADLAIPGLQKTLRPFQTVGVSFLDQMGGNALLADDMGLGKTVQIIGYLQLHPELRPAVIVCPATAKPSWERHVLQWMSDPHVITLRGKPGKNDNIFDHTVRKAKGESKGVIIIVNYDILSDWWCEIVAQVGTPEVIALDECFPAGTPIRTEHGTRPIEEIEVGDWVYNAFGMGQVQKVFSKKVSTLVRVVLDDGTSFECTPNHPIFTESGWVAAENLTGRLLFPAEKILGIVSRKEGTINENDGNDMRVVRGDIPCGTEKESAETLLRNILLREVEDVPAGNSQKGVLTRTQQEVVTSTQRCSPTRRGNTHDQEEPHALPCHHSEDARYQGTERDPAGVEGPAGREWDTHRTTETSGMPTSLVSGGGYSHKQSSGVPTLLQSGSCPSPTENCNRDRWSGTSDQARTEAGHQENRGTDQPRVVRVEILELGGCTDPGEGPGDGATVYNLQVSGHPSYYANEVLVHNCHAIKNPKAARTRAIVGYEEEIMDKATWQKVKIKHPGLATGCRHIVATSGTPIINRPIEFWTVLHMLRPDVFPSFWDYTQRFCDAKRTDYGWNFNGASNMDELHALLTKTVMIRRLKVDVMPDLPIKQRSVVPLELSRAALKAYAKLEAEFAVENARPGKKEPGQVLAQITQLKLWSAKAKLEAAIEWIKDYMDSGKKLVVFAHHHEILDGLFEALGEFNPVRLDGRTPPMMKQAFIDRFQEDPTCRIFIGGLKAAGVAITLTAADSTCFVEFPWTPSELLQAEDRVLRIGQESQSVSSYCLVAQDTLDDDITTLLHNKAQVIGMALDGVSNMDGVGNTTGGVLAELVSCIGRKRGV
jgi:SWI/SNF-related matrix-associated actin-dependent regulator 1 of chromatin subfamily A